MPDIFSEVDEEVRRERLIRLWKKFGPWLIGAVVLVIAGMAGQVLWKQYRDAERAEESDFYQTAVGLIGEGKNDEAIAALDELIAGNDSGYRTLARLQKAALLARAGRTAEALSEYQALAASSVDQRYRDYASLMAASLMLNDPDAEAVEETLNGLAGPDNPWRFSAQELLGLWHFNNGAFDEAEAIYARLLNDPQAPEGIRRRAREMLSLADAAAAFGPEEGKSEPLAEPAPGVADEENPARPQ